MRRLCFVMVLVTLGCTPSESARRGLRVARRADTPEVTASAVARRLDAAGQGRKPHLRALTDAEREEVQRALAEMEAGRQLRVTLVSGEEEYVLFHSRSTGVLRPGEGPPGDSVPRLNRSAERDRFGI